MECRMIERNKDSEEAQKTKIVAEILYLKYPAYFDRIKDQPSTTTADYLKKENKDKRLAKAVIPTMSITELSPFDTYLISEQERFMKDYTIEELSKIRDEVARNKKARDKTEKRHRHIC